MRQDTLEYRTLVDSEALLQHLEDPEWLILDARFDLGDPDAGRRAYTDGHLPSAHYVHLEQQLSSAITAKSGRHPLPDPQQLSAWFAGIGLSAATQVVVYDDMNGAMASRCWWLLRLLGHQRVAVLDGGLTQWLQAGYPLTTALPQRRHAAFSGGWHSEQLVSAEQLQDNLEGAELLLVDARGAERFFGEHEPIDAVAGHVPCATNRPLQMNLQPSGRFKPSAQLRDEWQQLIGNRSPSNVVHMCGSGVTACHNLLAMEVAGLSGSRIYPGSWSEWIRDSQRPVARCSNG